MSALVLVLLSAHVKRFTVFCMLDFFRLLFFKEKHYSEFP